jgi:hypothetical protein
VAAEDEEVEEASFAMRLAQLARMVAPLPPHEKAAFSAAMRAQGNAKFTEGDWSGAEELYMQSLVGLDFGTAIGGITSNVIDDSHDTAGMRVDGNSHQRIDAVGDTSSTSTRSADLDIARETDDVPVTSTSTAPIDIETTSMTTSTSEKAVTGLTETTTAIQVPVLCNLVACALAQRKWTRAVLLADHALNLDPTNWKALARKVIISYALPSFRIDFLCSSANLPRTA